MSLVNHDHTFVICAYKESCYLEECIQSLLLQKVRSKVIMVTSTPNEYIVETAHKHQIPLYINGGEGGIAQDWNFGYQCANTAYITIAHQDDIYFPEYVERMTGMIRESKHPLLLFTDYFEIRDGKMAKRNRLLFVKRLMLLPLRLKIFRGSKFIRRRILSFGSAICCPSVTFARNNLPNPVFQPGLKCSLDWEAWERISKRQGDFLYIDKPLMAHRIHQDSETSNILNDNKRVEEDYVIFRKFWPERIARLLVKSYSASEKSNDL